MRATDVEEDVAERAEILGDETALLLILVDSGALSDGSRQCDITSREKGDERVTSCYNG